MSQIFEYVGLGNFVLCRIWLVAFSFIVVVVTGLFMVRHVFFLAGDTLRYYVIAPLCYFRHPLLSL